MEQKENEYNYSVICYDKDDNPNLTYSYSFILLDDAKDIFDVYSKIDEDLYFNNITKVVLTNDKEMQLLDVHFVEHEEVIQ